tara:strand:- start:72 stop:515 length:444 start_codon:yes stop_codon:yes gene_type:complete
LGVFLYLSHQLCEGLFNNKKSLKTSMRKIFIFVFLFLTFNANAIEKETTFSRDLFNKAQSEGKVVVVSSWIKYCSSCASQMKVLNKAKNEFNNIEYFTFDVTNKEIANLLNVQFQTTLLIFKDNKEVYRSIGETTKDLIYKALKSSI